MHFMGKTLKKQINISLSFSLDNKLSISFKDIYELQAFTNSIISIR